MSITYHPETAFARTRPLAGLRLDYRALHVLQFVFAVLVRESHKNR